MKFFIVGLVCLLSWSKAQAELRVADIFSDHLVLQAGLPVPVWGWADAGQSVAVRWGGEVVVNTVADAHGAWRCDLPALAVSRVPRELVVTAEQELVFRDVLVGEVWYASGQSNMEWKMKGSAKKLPVIQELLDGADYPQIRYRSIRVKEQARPQQVVGDQGSWTICTPEQAAGYSAVAFLFARRLHLELEVPIGIIEGAWGGHPIEPFIPREAFVGHPVLEQEVALSDREDLVGLREMVGGVYARNASWLCGTIYNARVAPVVPYALRGVIWYQAESNSGTGEDPRAYAEKMKALMRGWRAAWGQAKLPVYYVQLPQYAAPGWVPMRDEQRRAMVEPDSGMVVTIDLALDEIHPANKLDVAERLARWPLAREYDRAVVPSGPLFRAVEIEGPSAVVRFDYAARGLVTGQKEDLQPTRLDTGKEVQGFELAGADRVWHPASARIQEDAVVCSSPQVAHPVAVRYGWAEVMPVDRAWNLYNRAGLPASPFISHPEFAPWQPSTPAP